MSIVIAVLCFPNYDCYQCTEYVSSRRRSCVKGDYCYAVVACDILVNVGFWSY